MIWRCTLSRFFAVLQKLRLKIKLERKYAFLKNAKGVIHVGANVGQERFTYEKYGLHVVWIEPIPSVFNILKKNIETLKNQMALQYLITDKDDVSYTLKVASNEGASSSIFDFEGHSEIWPDIVYVDEINIVSKTLLSVLQIHKIDFSRFDILFMDVQGSELLVLKGLGDYLHNFRYIQLEACDFVAYKGACVESEVTGYLQQHGFKLNRRIVFQTSPIGNCYDILYQS
jgi:FkbM family methyltransferase